MYLFRLLFKSLHFLFSDVSFLHGISGFARRLVLQLLLESEKIRVLVNSEVPLQRPDGVGNAVGLRHPSHGVGHRSQVVIISHYTTCAELIKLVVGAYTNLTTILFFFFCQLIS